MRQVREVIRQRQLENARMALLDKETELRIMASQIAGAAGWAAGMAQARAIRLVARPEGAEKPMNMIPYETAVRMFGG